MDILVADNRDAAGGQRSGPVAGAETKEVPIRRRPVKLPRLGPCPSLPPARRSSVPIARPRCRLRTGLLGSALVTMPAKLRLRTTDGCRLTRHARHEGGRVSVRPRSAAAGEG